MLVGVSDVLHDHTCTSAHFLAVSLYRSQKQKSIPSFRSCAFFLLKDLLSDTLAVISQPWNKYYIDLTDYKKKKMYIKKGTPFYQRHHHDVIPLFLTSQFFFFRARIYVFLISIKMVYRHAEFWYWFSA